MGIFRKNRKFYTESIRCNGGSITVSNGKVFVDGKLVRDLDSVPEKEVHIVVDGSVSKLEVDCCDTVEVHGDAGSVSTQSGDVKVSGNVSGNIDTMSGDVECGDVRGGIDTMSGDIRCSGRK